MESLDFATLLIRSWVGIVMVMHGINHGRSLEGTARWFEKVGFRSAQVNARMSAFAEIAIGLGIAAGLLTPFAIAGMVATMFVAFWSIHRFAGFFNFHRPDEGYEYVATLAVVGVALAIIGPGVASLDDALGIADDFDGIVGGAIALSGLLIGALQAAVFWRKPAGRGEK